MQSRAIAAIVAASAIALLAGCSGSPSSSSTHKSDGPIVMWTLEGNADRVVKQKAMLAKFTDETGVKVDLVPVSEDQLSTALTSAAASNELPDLVAALPLDNVMQFANDDILDTDATKKVIDDLGAGTFNKQALSLTQVDGKQLAVPSDAFPLLVYYRTDLFKQSNLAAPTDFASIEKAAETLKSSSMAGIVAATTANEQFTAQTFENFALANGCQLVDDAGKVQLDSKPCVDTFAYFDKLMTQDSVSGDQDTNSTRATYFAGKSAMLVWSSFLLDELAGLRNDALPTCDKCAADPTWLAKNTGVVGAIQGPDGSQPAAYGEVVSFALLKNAHSATPKLAEWLLGDGYPDWIGIAPEGKVPTRTGTADEPQKFHDLWSTLETGVDKRATLGSLYDKSILDAVQDTPNHIVRWGVAQGQGVLAGQLMGQRVIPTVLSDLIGNGGSPEDAAASAADQATQLQTGLG